MTLWLERGGPSWCVCAFFVVKMPLDSYEGSHRRKYTYFFSSTGTKLLYGLIAPIYYKCKEYSVGGVLKINGAGNWRRVVAGRAAGVRRLNVSFLRAVPFYIGPVHHHSLYAAHDERDAVLFSLSNLRFLLLLLLASDAVQLQRDDGSDFTFEKS